MSHMTNPLASSAQMERCRDRAARLPLPPELLDAVFVGVQCLTQAGGLLLELPQSATARASVVLARFWLAEPGFSVSLTASASAGRSPGKDDGDYAHVAAAALYMVAKTGASPRSARDVAQVFAYLGREKKRYGDDDDEKAASCLSDTAYAAFHTRVLALEARILCALGFDAHVALPHPLALTYLQAMEFFALPPSPKRTALVRRTVAYLNTALLSPQLLLVTHQPHELAVAALYSAARDTACHMPSDLPWWEVFDVDRETLGFLAVALRSVAAEVAQLRSHPDPRVATLLTGGDSGFYALTLQRVLAAAAA